MNSNSDDITLAEFRYKPELKRTLRLFSSFAVAFSFISISTGIFTNYGFVLKTAGPAGIWTWPIVAVGHLLVALVFAELAGRIPLCGYSYQWVGRLAGPGVGWLTGWIGLCFLVIVVPTVNYGCAPIIGDLLGVGTTPRTQALIVAEMLLIQAAINCIGVKLASRINNLAVYTEVLGITGMIVAITAVLVSGGAKVEVLWTRELDAQGSYLIPFVMAALMGAYTLVGFEASADMAEETHQPTRNVPRAIILSVVLSGIIGTLFLVVISLGISDLRAVVSSDNPIPYILTTHLGTTFSGLFLVLVIISVFACGLVIMAAGARLLYAMSRDNMFFASDLLKRISPQTCAPVNATILILVAGLLAVAFADSLTLFVGATAVLPAILYLITICAYAVRASSLPPVESFALGRYRKVVVAAAIAWLLVEIAILTAPEQFHMVAFVVAGVLAAGIGLYVLVFRRRLIENAR